VNLLSLMHPLRCAHKIGLSADVNQHGDLSWGVKNGDAVPNVIAELFISALRVSPEYRDISPPISFEIRVLGTRGSITASAWDLSSEPSNAIANFSFAASLAWLLIGIVKFITLAFQQFTQLRTSRITPREAVPQRSRIRTEPSDLNLQ